MENKATLIQDSKRKMVQQQIENELVNFSYADFENLGSNKAYDAFNAGELKVTSGTIVCADPMYKHYAFPQNWTVPTGNYPVNLYISLEGDFKSRVAYAELVFSQNPVVSWEMSLIAPEYLDDFGRKMNGVYPVENGLSSFSDYETWQHYVQSVKDFLAKNKGGNFYNDVMADLFSANSGIPASSRGDDWTIYEMGNRNMVMFGTGWGDGLYPRYVGFDEAKNPVKFITDFIQLK